MPKAVISKLRFGPDTLNAAAAATGDDQIIGGRLVEFSATETGKAELCAADSAKWLGVALYDAHPGQNPTSATPSGYEGFDYSIVAPEVAVAWTGVYKLDFVDAANPGDLVYPAASGQVKVAVGAATRAVGIVVNKTAIAAGESGYVRLF